MDVFLMPMVNVSLFPMTTKPLNIFEPRYLTMIRKAVEQQLPVALAFIEDFAQAQSLAVRPGETIPYVRTVAGFGFAQIIEERPNSTLLVFLSGRGKVRLGPVLDRGTEYLVVEADVIAENVQVRPEKETQLQHLLKILTRWIHTHIPDPDQQDIFMKSVRGPEEIVGAFSAYLVRDYDLQQAVLELDDINEKIQFLHRLVESNELTT
jgi:ATP-dependent Lon protease